MALIDTSPRALAARLLDEIARGMLPVWPSTERYAEKLARGLVELRDERRPEVYRAIVLAPHDTQIDWDKHLGHVLS